MTYLCYPVRDNFVSSKLTRPQLEEAVASPAPLTWTARFAEIFL